MTVSRVEHLPRLLVSRRWWRTSLLVMAMMVMMTRLGFWQLDRLENRRARNASITSQLSSEPLLLSAAHWDNDLRDLEYRRASVSGSYDHSRQIILKGQVWHGQPGVHLLTPLVFSGANRAVLVDRGWIPYEASDPRQWEQFAEPGPVRVIGVIRYSGATPNDTTPPANPKSEWYRVDIAALQSQMPYNLLPVYVQQLPNRAGNMNPPIRTQPTFDLSDGRHFSYAIQWYMFTIVLGVGYLHYLLKNS